MNPMPNWLSRQGFKKIEVKCVEKSDFSHIHYAIMVKVTLFSEL